MSTDIFITILYKRNSDIPIFFFKTVQGVVFGFLIIFRELYILFYSRRSKSIWAVSIHQNKKFKVRFFTDLSIEKAAFKIEHTFKRKYNFTKIIRG